jgi:hypothetical protein
MALGLEHLAHRCALFLAPDHASPWATPLRLPTYFHLPSLDRN